MTNKELTKLLLAHRDQIRNRTVLESDLISSFPSDRSDINALMIAWDAGIIDEIEEYGPSAPIADKLLRKMTDDNRIDQKRASRAIQMWFSAYGKGVLGGVSRNGNPQDAPVFHSDRERIAYYEDRASQNDKDAIYFLADAFMYGHGVPKNTSKAIDLVRRAAELGHVDAQFSMGQMYEHGRGLEKNPVIAFQWYMKAAEQGHSPSQFYVANMLDDGEGTKRDPVEAAKWMTKAADQNNPEAQCNLALFYQDGNGVPKDLEQAVKLFRLSADQGCENAMLNLVSVYLDPSSECHAPESAIPYLKTLVQKNNPDGLVYLGLCYANGTGTNRDVAQGIDLLKRACNLGRADAAYNLSLIYSDPSLHHENKKRALEYLRIAAESDVPEACMDLAHSYAENNDFVKAEEWGKRAVSEQDPSMMYNLGIIYLYNIKNIEKGIEWIQKAALKGYPLAMTALGTVYSGSTEGIPEDKERSRFWTQRAADLGEPDAQYNLALEIQEEGNAQEAIPLYKKAADQGHPMAAFNIGSLYYNGLNGIEQDYAEAVKWFRKSAESEFGAAEYWLGLCYINGLGVESDPKMFRYWMNKALEHGYEEAADALKDVETTESARLEVLEQLKHAAESAPQETDPGEPVPGENSDAPAQTPYK